MTTSIEAIRDMPSKPQLPIDENVHIPEHVRLAKEKAESYYAKPAAPAEGQPASEPAANAGAPVVAPEPAAPAAPAEGAPQATAPAPQAPEPVAVPTREDLQNDTWAGRYNSMKGRWEQSQQTIGQLQELLGQAGDENMRLQALLRGQQGQAPQPAAPTPTLTPAQKLITKEDEEHYGSDMIDMARRAAAEAVAPQINALQSENKQLKQTLQRTTQRTTLQSLADAIPDWAEINNSAEWKRWVRLPDVYSGQVRLNMLNAAYQAADAPRVIAFFKGFLAERAATTGSAPQPEPQPSLQPNSQPAPRQAAVPLDVLAAPGRARPAPGNTEVPPDKPYFTRAQIKTFYDQSRAGLWAGREVEKARIENEIFAAQREGRVRG